jgi:hypothetical protein
MNRISHLNAKEAKDVTASRRRAVQHHNKATHDAEKKLFRSGASYKLDAQTRANMSNAGRTNEREILDEQAKNHAIIAKGGRALPPPRNQFNGVARANAAYLKNLRAANAPKK